MECFYDDPVDVWDEVQRRARKIHTCHECYRVIKTGSIYYAISILYDGRWSRHKQCESCNQAFDMARQAGLGPYVDGLSECITEGFFDIEEKYRNFFRKIVPYFLPDYMFRDSGDNG